MSARGEAAKVSIVFVEARQPRRPWRRLQGVPIPQERNASVRHSTGRHRRTRTLSVAAAVAVAACAGGVHLGVSGGGAEAASTTVTVSGTAQLEAAVKNATAGTVIQVRAGTYTPSATLQSTADGTTSARITLRAYGSDKVKIDGSRQIG